MAAKTHRYRRWIVSWVGKWRQEQRVAEGCHRCACIVRRVLQSGVRELRVTYANTERPGRYAKEPTPTDERGRDNR